MRMTSKVKLRRTLIDLRLCYAMLCYAIIDSVTLFLLSLNLLLCLRVYVSDTYKDLLIALFTYLLTFVADIFKFRRAGARSVRSLCTGPRDTVRRPDTQLTHSWQVLRRRHFISSFVTFFHAGCFRDRRFRQRGRIFTPLDVCQ